MILSKFELLGEEIRNFRKVVAFSAKMYTIALFHRNNIQILRTSSKKFHFLKRFRKNSEIQTDQV